MGYEKKLRETLHDETADYEVVSWIERTFPELRESEDERIRKTLIHIVKGACGKYGIKYKGDEIGQEELLAYLEKQKEQKPAEWSEEDEDNLKAIIRIIEDNDSDWKELTDWLNSLHDNYKKCNSRWKPSEEQMSMLLAVINDPNNAGAESCQLALKSLYEHLKGLM